ncbi:MAG: molybdopterin cofactor-binding domain-containing protein, partial [Dehalococcoidia bacterium]
MTKKRGFGIGSIYYGIGYGFSRADISSVYIEMAEDGTTTAYSGTCDMGQGVMTIVAQVAAEVIGIHADMVRVASADTSSTPDAGATSASRSTFVQSVAVQEAAEDLRDQLLKMAADILHSSKEELEAHNGEIYRMGKKAPLISVAEVAAEIHRQGKRCASWGWHENATQDVDPETSQGDAWATYGWATQLVEVEVDTETGHVQVTKIVSATDAGKALNPLAVEGQMQGGATMGLGYALYEQHILDQGIPQTGSLAFYLVPSSMDVPEIECEIVEVHDPKGPLGAKGIAEPAMIPTPAAILNA